MPTMRPPVLRLTVAVGLLGLMGGMAHAQNCPFGADFDSCMATVNNMHMNQINRAQQQTFQDYVASNQEWLQRAYAQHRSSGGQMTPLQFAQWGLMTANGTNYAGALNAQRRQFEGNQRANRTIQEDYADYNAGSAANSAARSEAVRRWGEGAIRGNAPFIDPNTGQTRYLPYAVQPGQPFSSGGETYMQDPNGSYYQQRGNGWNLMNPGR